MGATKYRIQCGGTKRLVELTDEGKLVFRAHPGVFGDIDVTRAFQALTGEAPSEGEGCMRLALLVRQGKLSTEVAGGDDARRLLAALRGVRLARRLRRSA